VGQVFGAGSKWEGYRGSSLLRRHRNGPVGINAYRLKKGPILGLGVANPTSTWG
jgi:hypothetical protein